VKINTDLGLVPKRASGAIPLHAFVAWVGKKYLQIFLRNSRKFLKGKAIPIQAWTSPDYSRRLRLPDFKTFVT
jgi:hypothetical protein